MAGENEGALQHLIGRALGREATGWLFGALALDPMLVAETGDRVSRAVFAMALNMLLFDDLLRRVPSGHAYVERRIAEGGFIHFDHGALRTIRFAGGRTGCLPAGETAFTRILEPLGYRLADIYPLPALRMTGRAYRHLDHPQTIPQFFVSELHVDQFDEIFAAAAERIFGTSRDPLDKEATALLQTFARDGEASLDRASAALPIIAGAFTRQHAIANLSDYETLLAQSAEAAWIATEGNAFNHATDRVADVETLATRLKAEGWTMKDRVEISTSGRVRQTALRADTVERPFRMDDGTETCRIVPGSFYEFITRGIDPATGAPDLRFDSANATGIFAMTRTT